MRGEQVDERDSAWEDDGARYRLYTFEGGGNAVRVVDLWDCTLDDALDAGAEADRSGLLWSLALVREEDGQRGLVWLSGYDDNDAPHGVRVIRMFPEWGDAGPLWENFTDQYPADPARLGISAALVRELTAWNRIWNDRDGDAPLADADAWIATGRSLHARVQAELAGLTEVRPDFDR